MPPTSGCFLSFADGFKVRLYLETSALGALADVEDPQRVALTRELLRAVADGLMKV